MKKYAGNIAGIIIFGALTVLFIIHAIGGERSGKWDLLRLRSVGSLWLYYASGVIDN